MDRRTFLTLSSLYPASLLSNSFSLEDIAGASQYSYSNKNKEFVNYFLTQRLPKIIIKNEKMQYAINKLSQPLFKACEKKFDWKIFVVSEGNINAYTTGEGLILVDIKLIQNCENETQLASVIAHEIGHIVHLHTQKRMATNNLYNHFKVKGFNKTTVTLLHKSYSRQNEHEADAYIIKSFLKTDYSINEASAFFKILKNIYPDNRKPFECLFSTHPQTEERIKRLDRTASTLTQLTFRTQDSPEFKYLKSFA